MNDLLSFIAPFFATPRNYAEMLKRIAGFAIYEIYFITLFLRDIPAIGRLFRTIETYGSFGALIANIPNSSTLNIAGLGIAIFMATLAHISHLHNRLSDGYAVRETFDICEVLKPLARASGTRINATRLISMRKSRHKIMRKVFYKFASSTRTDTLVDRHDIEQALAAWSWFWALIEGAHYFLIAAVIALSFQFGWLGLSFLSCCALFGLGAGVQYRQLKQNARPQIEAIASDPNALAVIRLAFNAI